jgi:hypothetical protein
MMRKDVFHRRKAGVTMGAISLTMQCVINDDPGADDCLLVAPPEVVAVACTAGIEFTDVAAELPGSPPASGLFVCLPHSQVCELPPGWVGVWARPEALPQGRWVPLSASAVTHHHAFGPALQTADAWRRAGSRP